MTNPEISDTVSALKHESEKIHSDDPETIETINQLINKLEDQLSAPSIDDHHSLIEHMKETVESVEYRYPRITAIVNDLMVKLASLGV